jgi:hypothetical protein
VWPQSGCWPTTLLMEMLAASLVVSLIVFRIHPSAVPGTVGCPHR